MGVIAETAPHVRFASLDPAEVGSRSVEYGASEGGVSHLNPPRIFLRAATFNPQKMMMMMSYSVFVHRAVFAPTT